jgi:hypothetical protein
MNADGRGPRVVAEAAAARPRLGRAVGARAWSRDGRRIYFVG